MPEFWRSCRTRRLSEPMLGGFASRAGHSGQRILTVLRLRKSARRILQHWHSPNVRRRLVNPPPRLKVPPFPPQILTNTKVRYQQGFPKKSLPNYFWALPKTPLIKGIPLQPGFALRAACPEPMFWRVCLTCRFCGCVTRCLSELQS